MIYFLATCLLATWRASAYLGSGFQSETLDADVSEPVTSSKQTILGSERDMSSSNEVTDSEFQKAAKSFLENMPCQSKGNLLSVSVIDSVRSIDNYLEQSHFKDPIKGIPQSICGTDRTSSQGPCHLVARLRMEGGDFFVVGHTSLKRNGQAKVQQETEFKFVSTKLVDGNKDSEAVKVRSGKDESFRLLDWQCGAEATGGAVVVDAQGEQSAVSSAEVEALQGKVNTIEAELSTQKSEVQRLTKQAASQESTIALKDENITQLIAGLESQQVEQDAIKQLREELQTKEIALASGGKNIELLRAELDSKKSQENKEIEQLRAEVQAKDNNIKQLTADLAAKDKKIKELEEHPLGEIQPLTAAQRSSSSTSAPKSKREDPRGAYRTCCASDEEDIFCVKVRLVDGINKVALAVGESGSSAGDTQDASCPRISMIKDKNRAEKRGVCACIPTLFSWEAPEICGAALTDQQDDREFVQTHSRVPLNHSNGVSYAAQKAQTPAAYVEKVCHDPDFDRTGSTSPRSTANQPVQQQTTTDNNRYLCCCATLDGETHAVRIPLLPNITKLEVGTELKQPGLAVGPEGALRGDERPGQHQCPKVAVRKPYFQSDVCACTWRLGQPNQEPLCGSRLGVHKPTDPDTKVVSTASSDACEEKCAAAPKVEKECKNNWWNTLNS